MPSHIETELDNLEIKTNFIREAFALLNSLCPSAQEIPAAIRAEGTFLFMRLHEPLQGSSSVRFVPETIRGEVKAAADAQWAKFSPDLWALMVDRAQKTPNVALRAHYNDILWETKRLHRIQKPFLFAEAAAEAYLKWIVAGRGSWKFWCELDLICRRVAELGLNLRKGSWVQQAFECLLYSLLEWEPKGRSAPGLTLRLARSAIDIAENAAQQKSEFKNTGFQNLRALLEHFRSHFDTSPLGGEYVRKSEEILHQIDNLEGVGDSAVRQRSIAESLMKEGYFHLNQGNGIGAAHHFTEAISIFQAIGDSDAAATAKDQARKANAASIKQMGVYSAEIRISNHTVNDFINTLIGTGEWPEVLTRCSQADELIPDLGKLEERPSDADDQFLLSTKLQTVTLVGDRQIASDPDGRASMLAQDKAVAVNMAAVAFWMPFLDRAIEQGLSADITITILRTRGVIPMGHETSIHRGFASCFAGDYITALHLLTPQFEATLRSLLGSFSIDTTAFRSSLGGRMQERPMTVYFDEKDNAALALQAKSALTERLWAWLKFVFVDERGLNIRNNIAHGILPDEALEKVRCSLVALAFIRLLALVDARTPLGKDQVPSHEG